MKDFFDGMSKWPLLLGAVICFGLAIYEETVTDNTEVLVGIGGTIVGAVLLGAWLVLYIIDFERRWHDKRVRCEDADRVPDGLMDQRPDHE